MPVGRLIHGVCPGMASFQNGFREWKRFVNRDGRRGYVPLEGTMRHGLEPLVEVLYEDTGTPVFVSETNH
jgi:hypothetical protein